MNKVELRTIMDAAKRCMGGLPTSMAVVPGDGTREKPDFVAVKATLPFRSIGGKDMYFFISKRNSEKRLSLLIPVESTGILAVDSTLAILQDVLKTYNLILTQEAVIMEQEIALPFHKRMGKMAQALIAIDGIRRLWITQQTNLRSTNAEGQDPQSTGDSPNNRPSR